MHLIINHVAQLKHVDHADSRALVEPVSGASIAQASLAVAWQASLLRVIVYLFVGCSIEYRRAEFNSEFLASPSENGFVNLTQIHTRRHAERVQNDVHRSSVIKERHVFPTHDLSDAALVAMTTCHLITHGDLSLLSDVDFSKLHDSVRELVPDLNHVELPFRLCLKFLVGDAIVVDEFLNQLIRVLIRSPLARIDILILDALEFLGCDFFSLRGDLNTVEVADACALLPFHEGRKPLDEISIELCGFLVEVFLNCVQLGFLIRLCAFPPSLLRSLGIEICLDDCAAE